MKLDCKFPKNISGIKSTTKRSFLRSVIIIQDFWRLKGYSKHLVISLKTFHENKGRAMEGCWNHADFFFGTYYSCLETSYFPVHSARFDTASTAQITLAAILQYICLEICPLKLAHYLSCKHINQFTVRKPTRLVQQSHKKCVISSGSSSRRRQKETCACRVGL